MAFTCQSKALKLGGFALLLALVFPLTGVAICLSTVAAAGSKTILLGCRVTMRPHTAARLTRKGLPSQQAMLSASQLLLMMWVSFKPNTSAGSTSREWLTD